MKKFIFSNVIFVIFCLIIYTVFLLFYGKFLPQKYKPNLSYKRGGYGHLYSRLEDVKAAKPVDVLVVGSSHAYRGIDTRVFEHQGIKVFNLGSSSQSPIQSYYLLRKYAPKLIPKLIIYDVFPVTIESDGVESTLDLISNENIDFELLNMALKTKNVKVYNTLCYACFNQVINKKNKFVEQQKKGDDSYISGGFVEKKIKHHKYEVFKDKRIKPQDFQLKYVDSICQYASSRKIKVLLVNAPINKLMYKSYINFDSCDDLFSQKAMYINFNKCLQLSDSLHFYDSHHLNQKGVVVYSDTLTKVAKSILR